MPGSLLLRSLSGWLRASGKCRTLRSLVNQRYAHTVTLPGPRAHLPEASRYLRMTPWGPKPEFHNASSELPSLEMEPPEMDFIHNSKVKKSRQDLLPPDNFERVVSVLKKYGMDFKEIQQNPGLFSIPPLEVEDRLETFRECGWETYTADMIVFNNVILTKRTAKDVIGSESDSVTRSVLRSLLNALEIPEEEQQTLLGTISNAATGSLTLHDCRVLALRHFLRGIYSDDDAQTVLKVTMRPSLCSRPVKDVKLVLDILENEFRIPPDRVVKYTTILNRDRHHYRALMDDPKFMGFDIRLVSSGFPRLPYQPREQLTAMEDVFNKYGVTGFQVMRNLMVCALSPPTVEKRLAAIKKDNLLWQFHKDADFLGLVVVYVDMMRRVNFLRSMGIADFGLPLLICSRPQFHVALSRGTVRGPDNSVRPQHLLAAAEWLDMSVNDVKKALRAQVRNIPYFANDAREMQNVLQCLTDYEITRPQLLKCLSIVLYPGEVVRKNAEEVFNDPHVKARKHQENILHYLLYQIEKQTNFAGPAAWSHSDASLDGIDDEDAVGNVMDIKNTLNESLSNHFSSTYALPPSEETEDTKKRSWFEYKEGVA